MTNGSSRPPLGDVQLRDVEASDLPALYQYQLDPDANHMAAVNPRSLEAFNALWAKAFTAGTTFAQAILWDGILVGHIACFRKDGQDNVGYWIGKEYWGKGIASRALALLLEQVPTRPLHAQVACHNTASLRVLTRCGFIVTHYQFSPGDERYLECEEAFLVLTESKALLDAGHQVRNFR
jgi:RimJ/RimL family protein N-acetyltransferase